MTRTTRVTSTRYDRPYRPRMLAAVNAVGRRVGFEASLDPAELRRAACKTASGREYVDTRFEAPLEVLCRSIESEAQVHTVGRTILRQRFVSSLATRLKAEALLARRPEIAALDVDGPVVVTGLQRSGTTLLHRLLGADPEARVLASWEAIDPVGPVEPGRRDRRRAMARVAERSLRYMAPDFFAIHPVQADAPEEEVLLLDCTFMSTTAESILHVPSYASWLEDQDQTPAYEHMKTLLQVLLAQRPAHHWVLKTPHHLECLDVLRRVFPKARVIQTHRHPAETTASFCSMVAHGRGVFSDVVEPKVVGEHWLRKTARMMRCSMHVRETDDPDAYLDVRYEKLTADPMREVRRIYDWLGLPLTERAEGAMRRLLEDQTQYRFGRHRYALGDFGLDERKVEHAFDAYLERFDL